MLGFELQSMNVLVLLSCSLTDDCSISKDCGLQLCVLSSRTGVNRNFGTVFQAQERSRYISESIGCFKEFGNL